jgi:YD repeat-containing protein
LEGLTKIPKPRQWKAGQEITTGGEVIGIVDTDGKTLILNRNGLERLSRITRGNKQRAREIIAERGWKVGTE